MSSVSSSFSLLSSRFPCPNRRASFNPRNRTPISIPSPNLNHSFCKLKNPSPTRRRVVCSNYSDDGDGDRTRPSERSESGLQLYSQIERLITETAKQSQGSWRASGHWSEVEGAWVLKPRNTKPTSLIHFIGGIFVGAAPQLTYRFFLEKLSEKGILVVATPFASGFDHFRIADEAQFKFDRCIRALHDTVDNLPIFGVGHSLGSLIHLLIGSRYAVQRNGNVLMAFNNKEASLAIPMFSPVIVPMAQSLGPLLTQLSSSPAFLRGEIWHILEVTHEGTSQVKESRLAMLSNEYENFAINKDKCIKEMYACFCILVYNLRAIGKEYYELELVRKILKVLPKTFEAKVTTIQESKDLSKLKLEELVGNLITYEMELSAQENKIKEPKPLVLLCDNDDDMGLLVKGFIKFFRTEKGRKYLFDKRKASMSKPFDSKDVFYYYCRKPIHMKANCPKLGRSSGKYKESESSSENSDQLNDSEEMICYNCQKWGHVRPNCPLLKKDKGKGNKKVMLHTWDQLDEQDGDPHGLALMAHTDHSGDSEKEAEIAMKQLENLSPAIMRQAIPLVEQLPPLYMDLVNGREDFTPKPEETRRLVKSYYGVPRNLLIKFKDDMIDETPILATILSSESAISSSLDMSIRSIPGDHGLPLQQVFPDIPPSMANAVNQGGELLANLTTGTPLETVAKEVSSTFNADGGIIRAQNTKFVEMLVDEITTWMSSNSNPIHR